MRRILLAAAGASTLLGGVAAAAPLAQPGVLATPVHEQLLTLTGGSTYTITTSSLTAGADPVLRIWGPRYSISGAFLGNGELGADDDSAGNRDARLVFTPRVSGNQYRLILHAKSLSTAGTARLAINGIVINSSVSFGGNTLTVPSSTSASRYVYETAHVPGGATNTRLYAIDCGGALLEGDDNGGVGTQARIAGKANVCKVIVAGDGRRASVYTNDVSSDADRDGLGAGLEAELRTCDSFAQSSVCASRQNLADTDRDGLSDLAEVFGLDTSPPQYLPAWGADPLQKDAFVEVDYDNDAGFTSHPYQGDDAIAVHAFFQSGTAADVGNLNGRVGVRVHLDIGQTPSDPTDTRYGSWGGAGVVTNTDDYRAAPATNRTAARSGVFRYAFLTRGSGGGQASGASLTVGVSTTGGYTRSFAHELGHTFGLGHHGHDRWGSVNCKPHYRSLMNYAAGDAPGFSLGAIAQVLNPASVNESVGLGAGVDASYLGGSPFYLDADASGVDWNRSGATAYEAVRAAVNLGDADCQVADVNAQRMRNDDARGTLPEILRSGSRLYAFYVTTDGKLRYRHVAIGAVADGSCPGGGRVGDTCAPLSAEVTVPTLRPVYSVSAVRFGPQILVAFRTTSGDVAVMRTSATAADGTLSWTGEALILIGTEGEPEVAQMPVDPARYGGASEVIGLFYLRGGQYQWLTATSVAGPWTSRGTIAIGTTPLAGSEGASVVPWPSSASPTTACGAFPDAEGDVQFVCFQPSTNTFRSFPQAFGTTPPNTHGRPGLAYNFLRRASGTVLGDGALGQFVLTYAPLLSDRVRPRLRLSDTHDTSRSPLNGVTFGFDAYVTNRWATSPGGAVALYSHPDVGALKGVRVRFTDDNGDEVLERAVELMPLADGTVSVDLTDGNDFRVMERGICSRLQGESFCGSVGAWGY